MVYPLIPIYRGFQGDTPTTPSFKTFDKNKKSKNNIYRKVLKDDGDGVAVINTFKISRFYDRMISEIDVKNLVEIDDRCLTCMM